MLKDDGEAFADNYAERDQAKVLREQARAGGLRFEAYLPGDMADWLLAQVEQAARDVAARVAADPELARRLVRSFRRETAPGGMPWEVAVELERSPQMWSLRRKHG